ncbi:hypothetical protein RRG08_035702 [Elysia crispata]|uniref:Uncharacterized protein n=1 Tax=Elysia crispata TaxID=231223 RepID=A0AAE0YJP8_9GAST|nr:hypothetical protein RRG08_035702 [Elysia crispata]
MFHSCLTDVIDGGSFSSQDTMVMKFLAMPSTLHLPTDKAFKKKSLQSRANGSAWVLMKKEVSQQLRCLRA